MRRTEDRPAARRFGNCAWRCRHGHEGYQLRDTHDGRGCGLCRARAAGPGAHDARPGDQAMMLATSVNTENRLVDLGKAMPKVAMRALNRTGAKAVTLMVRTLTAQTGLPRKTIKRAVKSSRASLQNIAFALKTRGGNISLRYFKARETRAGV